MRCWYTSKGGPFSTATSFQIDKALSDQEISLQNNSLVSYRIARDLSEKQCDSLENLLASDGLPQKRGSYVPA